MGACCLICCCFNGNKERSPWVSRQFGFISLQHRPFNSDPRLRSLAKSASTSAWHCAPDIAAQQMAAFGVTTEVADTLSIRRS
jgi:hypothetical protein